MITELYALDQELTESSAGNDVTFEIWEKSGSTWAMAFALLPSQIVAESMELDQTICDEDELVIGGCIPSQLQLSVMNITQDLNGKRIVVKIRGQYHSETLYPATALYPSNDLFPNHSIEQTDQYVLFVGTIISYKRSENKNIRKIVALDRMYYASTVFCKEATYNYINDTYWDPPPEVGPPQTMKIVNLIHHFCSKGKVTAPSLSDFVNSQVDFDIIPAYFREAINDDFTPLQGLKWICELNSAFWIEDMPESLSLSSDKATPRNILLYRNQSTNYGISTYSQLSYEDYRAKGIRKATFFAHTINNEIQYTTIEFTNNQGYSIYTSNNGLTKSMQDAKTDAHTTQPERSIFTAVNNLKAHGDEPNRILGDIYSYRPFKASIFNRWWVQVGDRVWLPVSDGDNVRINSIVMSRKIKGINGMTVIIEAKGLEIQGKDFNTTNGNE